jgi:two-component sensor histidine kinase
MDSSGSNDTLADALFCLERSNSRDGTMQAVALAAGRLGGCIGVLLQGARNSHCEFFSACGGLPVDASLPSTSLSLAGTTGADTIHFLWSDECDLAPSSRELDSLRVLSTAGALALRRLQETEDAERAIERGRQETIESQHRFRNVLSFVRSIVRRTMQSAQSPEDFALHLEARISALSRTQATLHVAGTEGVEIEDLVRTELRANAIRDEQVDIAGPSVRLRARAAETMALALHELATNSLKYGALSGHGGRTSIEWSTDRGWDASRMQFRWLESGVRIVSAAPRHRGFGRELIESTLPYELDALTRFELTPGGLHCTVDLPLTARTMNTSASMAALAAGRST